MRARPLSCFCLFVIFIQTVILLTFGGELYQQVPASSIFYDEQEASVVVSGEVYKKTKTSKVQILFLRNNSVPDSKLMIYDENFIEIPIGTIVKIEGELGFFECAQNPGNFDQKQYYMRQNIYGYIWCNDIVSVSEDYSIWREYLFRWKENWREQLIEIMGEENGSVLSAIMLGTRDSINPDLKECYQKSGIGHILAISGLHISFIGVGMYHLLRKCGISHWISALVASIVLFLYVSMVGLTVSIFRAFIMFLVRMGAEISGRVYDIVTALLLAATITILYQPLYLMDGSFYLSYGAILGIVYLIPLLEHVCPMKHKWLAGIYASIAVNVMLLPIVLWNYFEVSTYGFLLNIVVIPLMSILLGAAVLGSLFMMLVPVLGKFCLSICGVILELYEWGAKISLKLPYARIVVGQPNIAKIIFYYLIICILLFRFYRKRKWKGLSVWFAVATLLLFLNVHSGLEMTMLNVGQGDGIFLRGPTGTTYFIDGGSSDVDQLGKYRIEPFLKSQGVGTLDYVFVSHGDADHYSGIAEMLERQEMGVKIRYLVLPIHYQNDGALMQLTSLAYKNGTQVLVIESEQRITEKDLLIQCVQPTNTDANVEGNASSMVLSISYKEIDFLFTGDVEGVGEERLSKRLPLDSYEVLKVSHHGSKNSSKESFLEKVQPQIALISAGEKNSYGHPHKETLERLKRMKCKVYSTKENGAIILQTDGNSLTITTFP